MLDDTLRRSLGELLTRLRHPVELIASLDDSPASRDIGTLLDEIASLSDRVIVRRDGQEARRPSFQVTASGADMGVRFAAVPLGHEFSSLVLALLQAGGHPPKIDPGTAARIRALEGDLAFETVMSLSCHNCPDVVQALNTMAVLNPRIRHVAIDGGLFEDEVRSRGILAVPAVFLDGQPFGSGRMDLDGILDRLDQAGGARAAAALDARAPFDMLVVGAGPAGAAAAIYAARKGIRTGIVAERFGGQTLDTLAIENYVSVRETDGPRFAAALQAHVQAYEVDVMTGQRVQALHTARAPGEPHTVELASGARLRARAVVLAPGARWRELGVPGEQTYRNKGVAYCPHCDGPLFKGRAVAVVGGGNSGVEAAIDLAGIAQHVTLFEFAPVLKADAVLVERLRSLPNVTVRVQAQTLEITGDGRQVDGLRWQDLATGRQEHLALAGVFVQIGLVPNTDFLRGVVELTRHGEIVVDARGATRVPGIFAAGDATTVPYKQIVVAAGDGAKAALGAFEHLIREPVTDQAIAA